MAGPDEKSSLWDGYGTPGLVEEEEDSEVDWDNLDVESMPRGLRLVRLCLNNVLKDMEIVAFQAISLVLLLTLLAIYLTWILPTEDWERTAEIAGNPAILIVLYPYLVVAVGIGTYFSAASIGVATMRLKGKNPTFRDGLRIANSKLLSVIGWAFVSASVGLVLGLLRRSKNPGTRLAGGVAQIGWAVGCYFVIPVMIFQDSGPVDAIHESTSLVKRTWKNALVGNFGVSGVFFLLALPSFLVLALFVGAGAVWVGIGFFITYLLIIGVFSSAAHSVLLSALYLIANGGKIRDFAAYNGLKDTFASVDVQMRRELPPGVGEKDYSLLKYKRP